MIHVFIVAPPLLLPRTRPDAPRLDSDSALSSFPTERPAPLKAKRSRRKADPDAAHRYTSRLTLKYSEREMRLCKITVMDISHALM